MKRRGPGQAKGVAGAAFHAFWNGPHAAAERSERSPELVEGV